MEGSVLGSKVLGFEFVNAKGDLVVVDRSESPELFAAFNPSLGLLGIITKLKLSIEDRFKVKGSIRKWDSKKENISNFPLSVLKENVFTQLYWFPNDDVVFEESYARIPKDQEKRYSGFTDRTDIFEVPFSDILIPTVNFILDGNSEFFYCSVQRGRMEQLKIYPRIRRKGWSSHEGIGWADELLSSGSGTVHDQTEKNGDAYYNGANIAESDYMYPITLFPQVIKELRAFIHKVEQEEGKQLCWPYIGIFIRFSKAESNTLISQTALHPEDSEWSDGMFSVGLSAHLIRSKTRYREDFFQRVNKVLADLGGRPHWAKCIRPEIEAARLNRVYGSNWEKFKTAREELDPNGIFLNAYGEELIKQ